MSVFRPGTRVSAPDGRGWELYAYRLRLPKRGATWDPGLSADPAVGVGPGTAPEAATFFGAGPQ